MKYIRPIILITLSLLAISACAAGAGDFGFGQPTPTPAGTPTPLPTPIKVFQTTIAADGQVVLPIPPQTFSFQSSGLSGTIAEIYVVPGQAVKKGDLLARIDDTDLRNALARAEASLAAMRALLRSRARLARSVPPSLNSAMRPSRKGVSAFRSTPAFCAACSAFSTSRAMSFQCRAASAGQGTDTRTPVLSPNFQ